MVELRYNWTVETDEELTTLLKPAASTMKLHKTDGIAPTSRKFAARSSFACITTRRADGLLDVSPLGGEQGMIRALDERKLFIALDGPLHQSKEILNSIRANAFCGLVLMIPGLNETMRINGIAGILEDRALLEEVFDSYRRPEAAIQLEIEELWTHCPKAFVRSELWDPEAHPKPSGSIDLAGDEAVHFKKLDCRCRELIARSPFLVLGSSLADGGADASPRGDPPGFVRVLDDKTLLLPDRPGNRLADNFRNVLRNPFAALLFLVPGSVDSLRVCGQARLIKEPELLEPLSIEGKRPKVGLLIDVRSAVLEHSRAIMRSRLWDPASRVECESLPSTGEMVIDQIQSFSPAHLRLRYQ